MNEVHTDPTKWIITLFYQKHKIAHYIRRRLRIGYNKGFLVEWDNSGFVTRIPLKVFFKRLLAPLMENK